MAQFKNFTQAETFARTYCRTCIHQIDCPVMSAHMALMDTDEIEDPNSVLHMLIEKNEHGDHRCLMHVRRQAVQKVA